jgi:hypothetical protein
MMLFIWYVAVWQGMLELYGFQSEPSPRLEWEMVRRDH